MKINRKMYGVHFLNEVNSLCLGYILKILFQFFALPVPLFITKFYLQYLAKASFIKCHLRSKVMVVRRKIISFWCLLAPKIN